MQLFQSAVYLLCLATSLACAALLVRSYRQSRMKLVLWSSLCFIALACSNLFLFLDIVILPSIDLLPMRQLSALAAIAILLYGLVWEAE